MLVNSSRYGKVWEISVEHITHEAHCFLQQAIINQTDYQTLNFQLFTFPGVTKNCVGVKLMATPWNDESLQIQFDSTQKKLIAQQKQAGLPDSFISLLHKAAREDVRILVFDPIADPVKGLETYD